MKNPPVDGKKSPKVDVYLLRSKVIMQPNVQGCISSLTQSDPSDSRKRTRASLPANGVGKRSVLTFDVPFLTSAGIKCFFFFFIAGESLIS